MNFRPPRGRPIKRPDGTKTYKYSRPTKPDGPSSFVTIIDAATGKSLYRRDGRVHGLAYSSDRIGFWGNSELIMVDRATWKATEFDVPGPVNFLAMNDHFVVVVGYGKERFSYRRGADGTLGEPLRWPVKDNARFINIHPTNRLVSVGYTEPPAVEIWDPKALPQAPVFVIEGVRRAHFLADGEHLMTAHADRNKPSARVFSLS